MVLYYTATFYQLLCCIVHKQKYHKGEKAILAVDNHLMSTCTYLNNIVQSCLFDELYALPYLPIKDDNIKVISLKADEIINQLPYKLAEFDNIYVSAAHFWFGIYLAESDITFSMFEECNGILSSLEKLRENVRNTSIYQDKYADALGLYDGSSPLTENIYCSDNNDECVLDNPKVIIFNLMEELVKAPNELRTKICSIFTGDLELDWPENATLILTQHFANLNIMDWEEQKDIYRFLIDYFTEPDTKIIFKPHPADIMDYENIFTESEVFRTRIPSELLPFLCRNMPQSIITVSSTAINLIGNLFKRCISFDFLYEQDYPITHGYYLLLKQTAIYADYGYSFYTYGVHELLLDNLNNYSDLPNRKLNHLESLAEFEILPPKKLLFMDDFYSAPDRQCINKVLLNLSPEDIIIFFNSKYLYFFYDITNESLMENLIPIEVKSSKEEQLRTIYAYSKGGVNIMSNTYKKLHCEDCTVYTEMFQDDKLKIKVLEGILKATEERLRFYLSREQELLEKLEEK